MNWSWSLYTHVHTLILIGLIILYHECCGEQKEFMGKKIITAKTAYEQIKWQSDLHARLSITHTHRFTQNHQKQAKYFTVQAEATISTWCKCCWIWMLFPFLKWYFILLNTTLLHWTILPENTAYFLTLTMTEEIQTQKSTFEALWKLLIIEMICQNLTQLIHILLN